MTGYLRNYILDEPTLEDIIRIHMIALDRATCCWYEALKKDEDDYMYLTTAEECGLLPQEARSVLPNDCKTDIVVTGFASDWKHFFDLRSSKAAHPDIRELSCALEEEFKLNNYI